MDNWKVVICLMISLSRFTSLTDCAKSWKHKTDQLMWINGERTREHTLTLMASRAMRRFSLSVGSVVCLTSSWRNTGYSQSQRPGSDAPQTAAGTYLDQQVVFQDPLHGDHEQVSERKASAVCSVWTLLADGDERRLLARNPHMAAALRWPQRVFKYHLSCKDA